MAAEGKGKEGDDAWDPQVSVCGRGQLKMQLGFGEWKWRVCWFPYHLEGFFFKSWIPTLNLARKIAILFELL